MKKKILGLLIAVVALVSTIGVGFASWVITQDASKDMTAQINVEQVVDRRIALTMEWKDGKSEFNFTSPSAEAQTSGWLKVLAIPASGDNAETLKAANLSVTLVMTIKNSEDSDSTANLDISVDGIEALLSAVNGDNGDYLELKAVKLVHGSDSTDLTLKEGKYGFNDDITVNSTSNTVAYQLQMVFGWGDHFGNENPYTFYNAKTGSAETETDSGITWADDAKTALTALYNALGRQISISVAVNPVA